MGEIRCCLRIWRNWKALKHILCRWQGSSGVSSTGCLHLPTVTSSSAPRTWLPLLQPLETTLSEVNNSFSRGLKSWDLPAVFHNKIVSLSTKLYSPLAFTLSLFSASPASPAIPFPFLAGVASWPYPLNVEVPWGTVTGCPFLSLGDVIHSMASGTISTPTISKYLSPDQTSFLGSSLSLQLPAGPLHLSIP